MTQPRAAITFNSSTGSDTAASGLGPATAISGSAAAHTSGSVSTTITLTNTPDLSGVQAGDLLWLDTAAGRQYSVIVSADNGADTVTVDDSFTIAAVSAVNYAIGGKRATFNHADSRTMFIDCKAGWVIQTETDQTISSVISPTVSGDTTNGYITVKGDSAATKRIITQSANASHFSWNNVNYWAFENLEFHNTNATKGNTAFSLRGVPFRFKNCTIGNATNKLHSGFSRSGGSVHLILISTLITDCVNRGIDVNNNSFTLDLSSCIICNNGSDGIGATSSGGNAWTILDSIIHDNTGNGILMASTPNGSTIHNTIFKGNGGDGLDMAAAAGYVSVNGCIFTENGAYGINANATQDALGSFIDYNAFGSGDVANTSGARNNLSAGAHDVTLTVDPFVGEP